MVTVAASAEDPRPAFEPPPTKPTKRQWQDALPVLVPPRRREGARARASTARRGTSAGSPSSRSDGTPTGNRPELVIEDGALVTTFTAQLPVGGRSTISQALSDFCDENDVKGVLPAGRFRATAEFVGTAAPKPKKLGEVVYEPHLTYMHYWERTIKSGECEINVPGKTTK